MANKKRLDVEFQNELEAAGEAAAASTPSVELVEAVESGDPDKLRQVTLRDAGATVEVKSGAGQCASALQAD